MAKKRQSESLDPKGEEPAKKSRLTSTGKEPLADGKHYDLAKVLDAIGFIGKAGEVFEKLARNWYARHRPARILSPGDVGKSGGQFHYMIVDFIIEYGAVFWSKEARSRGHLVNKGSIAYQPTHWRKGEHITFLYPRDSVHRMKGKGLRNFTQEIQREEQLDSYIFAALKPYFAGLHFKGRVSNENKDPDGFEDWPLSDDDLAECLKILSFMSGGVHTANADIPRRSLNPSYVRAGKSKNRLISTANPTYNLELSSTPSLDVSAALRRSSIPVYCGKADNPRRGSKDSKGIESIGNADNTKKIDGDSEATGSTDDEGDAEVTTSPPAAKTDLPSDRKIDTSLKLSLRPDSTSRLPRPTKIPSATPTLQIASMKEESTLKKKTNEIEAQAEARKKSVTGLGKGVVKKDGK